MHIGIDARIYGAKNGGIGRFTEEFVRALSKLPSSGDRHAFASAKTPFDATQGKPHTFVVFLRAQDMARVRAQKNIEKICADIRPFTLKEQIVLPHIFRKAKLDLLHIPHHAIARGYGGETIVTVHDLIEYRADRNDATTLPSPLYRMKRAAFRRIFEGALSRASAVVAVSRFVRRDCAKTFPALPADIPVIHHGAPPAPAKNITALAMFPYILYVGSLAPHKNGERLLAAFRHAVTEGNVNEHLVVITPKDFHFGAWREVLPHLPSLVRKRIHIVHAVSDKRLMQYTANARLFVSASREEGYGLPCIEALSCGTPVLAGFTGVLPEMSVHFPAGKVFYWDTGNVSLMSKQLTDVLRLPLEHFDGSSCRKKLPSWDDAARAYVRLYENVVIAGKKHP